MNCTKIKRIIDEVDRPDVFPLEAAGHLAGCPDCQSFADERAKLRELTGSVARVTAPANFNALLNERLSRVKSQRSSWLSAAGVLRVGTAAAGLLVVFIALQYGGFLSTKNPAAGEAETVSAGGAGAVDSASGVPSDDRSPGQGPSVSVKPAVTVLPVAGIVRSALKSNLGAASRTSLVAASRAARSARPEGSPFFLVRDNSGDRTVPMIPVSVGMQQQVLNASYGRQQPRGSDISY